MKKIVSGLLVVSLCVLTLSTQAFSAAFTDVSDRYKAGVDYIVEMNYASGTSPTTFGTDASIKRIDAAVMVARTMGFNENTNAPASGFSDVPQDRAWAVNALVAAGIVNGKLNGKYGSNDPMTRSEMAKVIASAYGLEAKNSTIPFTDVSKTFRPYVAALVENGITSGKTATNFGGSDNIKRGEFAIFIYKADGLSKIPPEVETVE